MISFTASFNDLCTEIEVLEERINDMERERKFLRKSMYANAPKFKGVVDYSSDKVTGGQVPLSLDKIVERLNKIDDQLAYHYEALREKKSSRDKIEKLIEEFEGLEYKVAYMRDVKGMKLYEIADELGYSHDHIRRVSSRVKKPQTRHKNVVKS